MALLEIRKLGMAFGGLRALDEVTVEIEAGRIDALIGPNGAGKTTLFNCVTGIYRPTAGTIDLNRDGAEPVRLDGLPTHRITARGVARTFQNIRLFAGMSAIENVMLGRHCRTRAGLLGAIVNGPGTRQEEREIVARSRDLLAWLGLGDHADELAGNLPYGAQRRLEIARALACDPYLLLLDEPAAGMNPQETRELDELIAAIRDQFQLTILLIEHDMRLVMNISDRIHVLEHGRLIASGTPQEVRSDPRVIKAYLGEEDDDA